MSGKAVRGTRRSAVNREKPKVSHNESRPGKSSRRSQERTYQAEQSTSVAQHLEVSKDKQVRLERRGSTSSSNKSPRKQNRPPSAHGNHSFPKLTIPSNSSRQDPSYYGIPSPAVGIPGAQHNLAIRPRAQTSQTYSTSRPSSFYASSTSTGAPAPPLSYSAAFFPTITPSYPPPSPSASYMRYAATPQPTQSYSVAPAYQAITQGADYFTPQAIARPLASRFDPIARTQSAMDTIPRSGSAFGTRELNPRGFHETYSYEPTEGSYYDDGYASANEVATIRRRSSKRASTRVPAASAFSKAEADTRAMPPPAPRAGILRRSTAAGYSHEPIGHELEYRDSRTQYRDEPRGTRRPSLNRHSVSYDLDTRDAGVSIEPANTGRRRQSYYNQSASSGAASSAYEERLKEASNYQADVAGPTVPLTAEVLRRQQRREAGSSRSTKSSASRDESDYKKSATTRTTRSGSGADDENVTIKVTGQARVMVGNAQIDCTDGGAIEIKQNPRSRRMGSERSNSEYGENRRIEDRQSRITRPSTRSRMSSQSGQSYTRTPQFPPMGGNYI